MRHCDTQSRSVPGGGGGGSTAVKVVDLKACYALREGLRLFDYTDPSSADTVALLVRGAVAPAWLRHPEGRKLISFFFQLHAPLIGQLMAAIKNQV
jgi:hypothetical protein